MTAPKTIPAPSLEPAPPPMRNRIYRCDDPTYDDAMAQAVDDGTTLSEVIRYYLLQYGSAKRQSRKSPVKGSSPTRKRQSSESPKRQSRG